MRDVDQQLKRMADDLDEVRAAAVDGDVEVARNEPAADDRGADRSDRCGLNSDLGDDRDASVRK
jgi:hypothetical protein